MESDSDTYSFTADMSGPSLAADCLDCLVAFPAAVDKMRTDQNASDVPESMIAHTSDAFANFDNAGRKPVMVAVPAIDNLYQNASQLAVLDQYTRAYISLVVHNFFRQLKKRNLITYYILDNALREDRYLAVCELFRLAGISVVTPHVHGTDWNTLSKLIKSGVHNGSHVAYIEPDAAVNHIELAIQLGKELDCITTFRNLGPEDAKFEVVKV